MAGSITSRRLIVLGLVGVMATLLLLALPTPTAALPDYAAKTGQTCGVCHVNPAGGGALTPRGQAFAAIPTHFTDPAGAFAASAPAPAATATTAPAATPTTAPAAAPAATATRAPAAAAATATAVPTTALPRTGGIPFPLLPAAALSALALGLGFYLRKR